MSTPIRFAAPVALAIAIGVAGCSASAAPSTAASARAATASTSPTPDPAALAAYTDAMCPIFQAIVTIDPRISDLRAAADAGEDLSSEAAEMTAVSEGLLEILNDLEAVPEWAPGAALRYQLIVALHEIRATLLRAGRDPTAEGTQADVAALPFIADDALDRAMSAASDAGLSCEAPT